MNENEKFALVPRPLGALEKAEPGAKRILSGMVEDMLALAQTKAAFSLSSGADPENYYREGERHYWGDGVPKNRPEAIKCYRKAAEQGHPLAQIRLGSCYYIGKGVAKDFFEAAKWYREAAKQGEARGQMNLGHCYAGGKGVPKDEVEAVSWYLKAAQQDAPFAALHLIKCYRDGKGVPKDREEEMKWTRIFNESWNKLMARDKNERGESGETATTDKS